MFLLNSNQGNLLFIFYYNTYIKNISKFLNYQNKYNFEINLFNFRMKKTLEDICGSKLWVSSKYLYNLNTYHDIYMNIP